ncbi:hypothetical protein [Microseira wollei]|uniref:Uncharacterized protein n=1 Tax=Microseira wollei NIES-4236 TaxID=2530354 RepID=A0AAV3XFH8_9CYAN|nr:hypothetical protein [Microseira wollei]GET39112.1 hypothetical protein MiSe_38760 [Microseira wollei NIES-4236]
MLGVLYPILWFCGVGDAIAKNQKTGFLPKTRFLEQYLFIKQDETHKTPVIYAGDLVQTGLLSPVLKRNVCAKITLVSTRS